MSESRDEIIRKTKEWLVYADEDLRLAKHAFKLKSSCRSMPARFTVLPSVV
jgi:hypothetical protein